MDLVFLFILPKDEVQTGSVNLRLRPRGLLRVDKQLVKAFAIQALACSHTCRE